MFIYKNIEVYLERSVEQLVKWELAEETEVLVENLPHCHFFLHISYLTWVVIEPWPLRQKQLINCLTYAKKKTSNI